MGAKTPNAEIDIVPIRLERLEIRFHDRELVRTGRGHQERSLRLRRPRREPETGQFNHCG